MSRLPVVGNQAPSCPGYLSKGSDLNFLNYHNTSGIYLKTKSYPCTGKALQSSGDRAEARGKTTPEQKVQPQAALFATVEPKQEESNAGAKSAAEGCTFCDGGAEARGKQRRSKKLRLVRLRDIF